MSSFVIKDVYAYYARMNNPQLKYGQNEDKDKPLLNKEYTVQILMPVKELKKYKKQYGKSVAGFAHLKEYDAESFKEQFKCDPPEADGYCNSDGEYLLLKVNKHASQKDGSANDKPEVVGRKKGRTEDINGLPVSQETALGNGTLGNIQISVRTIKSKAGAKAFDLQAFQVVELVPYSEDLLFDDDDDDDFEEELTSDSDDSDGFDDDDDEESEDEEEEEWDGE